MVSVNHEDFSLAFSFVSSDSLLINEAYVSLDTGRIFWVSDLNPDEEQDIPDDLQPRIITCSSRIKTISI